MRSILWWFGRRQPRWLVWRTKGQRVHFTCNLARGRTIPKQKAQGIKVHRSVRMRQEAMMENGKKYKPKAQFFVQPTYVD